MREYIQRLGEKSERGAAAWWRLHPLLLIASGVSYYSIPRIATGIFQSVADWIGYRFGKNAQGESTSADNPILNFIAHNGFRIQQSLGVLAGLNYAISGFIKERPMESVAGIAVTLGYGLHAVIEQKAQPYVPTIAHDSYFVTNNALTRVGDKAFYAMDVIETLLQTSVEPFLSLAYRASHDPLGAIEKFKHEIWNNPRRYGVPLLQTGSVGTLLAGIIALDPFQTCAGIARVIGNERLRQAKVAERAK
ncbi:MAG: hypothetical protein EYC62_08365 [Alphaproteobacteria bacterium]|nr:MAG: hypothetical protein EYC62_08365 [Alphaproteobacteria bacterium]